MEVANDTCLLVEANDVIMEDEQQVAEDATKMQKDVVTEYQRIDSTVIERIMQTLRDCLSRKLITADPRNAATFHRGYMSSARAGFWASDPNHDSMTTSPASFFDIVYGNEGMHHLHLLQSLRDSGRSIISTETGVACQVEGDKRPRRDYGNCCRYRDGFRSKATTFGRPKRFQSRNGRRDSNREYSSFDVFSRSF